MKKIFLLLISAATLTTTVFAQPKKIVADRILGVVGDRIILESDIKNSIADAQRQGGDLPDNPECVIMEQAFISKVMMMQAEKDSLPVGEDEIEAELDQRVRYFINAYGTQEELERIAGKTIYQIKDDARESVKENKLAQAMQRKIVENVRITPNEAQAFFNKIPKDSLPFFETELEIGQIVVYPKASRDLEKYVMDEMANYKHQIEAKTTTFEQMAKRYSEEPNAKESGGLLPQMSRGEKMWDPTFLGAAFRLKDGEISPVIKSKFGYHIIQMVQRNGDNALVRHILRKAPVTDEEIRQSIAKLDSVRAKLITGTIDFSTAAGRYSDDETAKFSGPYITSRDGDTYNTIDELDKEVVAQLGTLRVGEYSQPLAFTNERGDRGVRILYLKNRTEPHRLNLKDDYNKISQSALEEKKAGVLEKWLKGNMANYYIMLDPSVNQCDQLQKWSDASKVANR